MVNYLIPKNNVIVNFPNIPLTDENKNFNLDWGFTNVVSRKISIPWYTLRSKKEFFDTTVHEAAHLSAYEHEFSSQIKNILREYKKLDDNYQKDLSPFNELELKNFISINHRELESFAKEHEESQGQHWGNPWYLKYRKFFNKLLNSPWGSYAYQQRYPRVHGFYGGGKGTYEPE